MTTFFVVPYVKGPAYQYLRFFKPCSGLYPAKGASTWVVMSQLHHMMISQPFWKLSGTCFSVPILHTGLCSSIAQFPWCPTVSLRQLENLIIFFFHTNHILNSGHLGFLFRTLGSLQFSSEHRYSMISVAQNLIYQAPVQLFKHWIVLSTRPQLLKSWIALSIR